MLNKICVIVKLLIVQVAVCRVLHQDLSNIPSSPDTLRRRSRQTNNLSSPINGVSVGNIAFQNLKYRNTFPNLENKMVQNLNSLPMNMATQNVNNLAIERPMQNGNNINTNGFHLNQMPANNIQNYNSLTDSSNLLHGNGIPSGNNLPFNNIGKNEDMTNSFTNFNNFQIDNAPINNWPCVNSNGMQNTNNFQIDYPAPLNLPGSYNFGNNFPVNNIIPNNNINKITNSIRNNLPTNNMLSNNMLFSNAINHLPQSNMLSGNGFGNCLPNQSPISKYFPKSNGIPGIQDFQMNNAIGQLNNGLSVAGNNVPFVNNNPFNGLKDADINDPFTITSNIPLHTIIPRSVINNNERILNNGLKTNEFSTAGRIPPNTLPFNNWPGFNNMMMSKNCPIGNNCQVNANQKYAQVNQA